MGFRDSANTLPGVTVEAGPDTSHTFVRSPDMDVAHPAGNPVLTHIPGAELDLFTDGAGSSEMHLRTAGGPITFEQNLSDGTPVFEQFLTYSGGAIKPSVRTWANIPLGPGWVIDSAAFPAQALIDAAGTVHIHGRIRGGTTGVISDMGANLAPTRLLEFALKSNNDAASVSWIRVRPVTDATPGRIEVVGNTAAAQVMLALTLSFTTL